MPRSRVSIERNIRRAALRAFLVMGMLSLVPCPYAAAAGAVVSGVVRDGQGVAQMGALVQVLGSNSATVATAFTDAHGRYVIANLDPGMYLVRASASLFVPATKAHLQLRTGVTAVVNLTLAALYDTASWLPAERRRADEPDDDWKWTLRSTANRPILRVLDNGSLIQVSTSASEPSSHPGTKGRAGVIAGDGGFAAGGLHNIFAIHRLTDDGGDMLLRADIGSARVPPAVGPSQEIEAAYERREGFDGAARTVVSYKAHPELVAAGSTAGLEDLSVTSAQRMSLGDVLALEIGGSLEMVNTTRHATAAHPFVRVTTRPVGNWTLHYRMATDRNLQGFEDVTTGQSQLPVALLQHGRLALESGRHQEVAVDRKAGRATVSLAYFHDAIGQAVVSGGGSAGPGETLADRIPAGMLVDPTTGSFKTLVDGYKSDGVRFTVSTPLIEGLWMAAEYSNGDAVSSEAGGLADFASSVAAMHPRASQSATLAIKGKITPSGTRVRASYRWQPAHLLSAVDPFSPFSDQAFLSCQLRQPLRLGTLLPAGLNATIDVTNLLAEGYRPFLSPDGQTLYFAQAPRTLQGGLSFTF